MKTKIKNRKTWGTLKPITKRIESLKIYKRSKNKFNYSNYSWGDLSWFKLKIIYNNVWY